MGKNHYGLSWQMPEAPWKRVAVDPQPSQLRHTHPLAGLLVYIAGPMRGYPERNHPAFREARALCERLGIKTRSPLDVPENHSTAFHPTGAAYVWEPGERDVFRADLRFILDSSTDGILMLAGWERSEGARFERDLARIVGGREFHVLYNENTGEMFDIVEVASNGR